MALGSGSKSVTRIGFSFTGCVGRERKPKLQIVLIERVDGHIILNDAQKLEYFEKARAMIKDQKMKVQGSCTLKVNHAEVDEMFESVNLMPKQLIKFDKG